jgi:hypothetical protein
MGKKLFITLFCIPVVFIFFIACTDGGGLVGDSGLLIGIWLANDLVDRLIFRDDGTFVSETFNGATWDEFISGTFVYIQSDNELTLTVNGNDLIQNLILNSSQDTLGMALDAYTGGDTATLLGTWTSTQVIESSSLSVTRTWTFGVSKVWYDKTVKIGTNPPTTDTYNGDVSINTVANTFTVTFSDDTINLPNDTYDYLVLGDGVVITDPNDMEITYYEKQ